MNRLRSVLSSGAVAALVLGTAASAAAQEQEQEPPRLSERFSSAGTLAISSDGSLSLRRTDQSDVDRGTTTITLVPAVDFFLIDNLSLGGFFSVSYTDTDDTDYTRIDVGPRIGYNIPLADYWSIWPRAGVSYAYTKSSAKSSVEEDVTVVREVSDGALALNLSVPVLFHPVEHFFAGFGPFVDTDLSGDNRTTVWGAKLTLGGWL